MEEAIARLVHRELDVAGWPPVLPEVANRFSLVVLLLFPWLDLFEPLLEAQIAVEGRPPSFRCRDCYYGVPVPLYRVGDPKRGHCAVGCLKSYCRPFARRSLDGADRFFITHAHLFFGPAVSPEVLAVTVERILTMPADLFHRWLQEEIERVLYGYDEGGRAWLMRVQLPLREL